MKIWNIFQIGFEASVYDFELKGKQYIQIHLTSARLDSMGSKGIFLLDALGDALKVRMNSRGGKDFRVMVNEESIVVSSFSLSPEEVEKLAVDDEEFIANLEKSLLLINSPSLEVVLARLLNRLINEC